MKTKIEQNGMNYQKIPHVGKTIATLNGCKYNLIDTVYKLFDCNSEHVCFSGGYEYLLKDSYRGTSKVNPQDIYNEATGEVVAYNKTMSKYHKEFDRKMHNILMELRTVEAAIEHYMDKRDVDYSKLKSVDTIKKERFTGIG